MLAGLGNSLARINCAPLLTRLTSADFNDVKSDKLALINVDRTMAGLYVCTASNGIPNQVSRQIPVYVKFPPKVSIEHAEPGGIVYANLGDQVELNCLIEAFPKPTIYWSGRQLGAPGSESMSSRLGRVAPPRSGSLGPRWYLGMDQHRAIWTKRKQSLEAHGSRQYLDSGATRAALALGQRQRRSPVDKSSDGASSDLASAFNISIITTTSTDSDKADDGGQDSDDARQNELIDGETVLKSVNGQLVNADEAATAAERNLDHQRGRVAATGSVQQAARILSPKGSPGSLSGPVTVSQTAQNAYTYKLKMTIAKVRASYYGEYICIATNSMGTASARVQVRGK